MIMKKMLVSLAVALTGVFLVNAQQLTKPFPPHWGDPPKVQTRDSVQLPGNYGFGSSTLAKWINANLEKDVRDANRPKSAEPVPEKPKRNPATPDKPKTDDPVPSKPTRDRTEPAKSKPDEPAPTRATRDKTVPAKPAAPDQDKKLTKQERKTIEDYVAKHRAAEQAASRGKGKGKGQVNKTLPPGLTKKVERGGDLPPGWQDKLTVGETLPEKVLEQAQPLPKDISAKLPAAPAGTTNVVIEGKVLRVMTKTRQVLDVLDLNK